jgi:hypothetical protein
MKKPAASHSGSAFPILGKIWCSSFLSLLKKMKASNIINAASISLQYNLGENDDNLLCKSEKVRNYFSVKVHKPSIGKCGGILKTDY